MRLKNSNSHFGLVAILLHWIMAVLIIGLLVIGIYMVELPISLQKLKLYGWHKEYGLLALALVVVRLCWRIINISPELSLPRYEIIAARIVHWAFYGFMFAMPITGWLITSAAGLPASFFGLFTLPNLIAPNEEQRQLYELVHEWLGYGLIVTILLHASAALKHHFINRDNVLRRMIS
ncbi:cytochrome b561 transmembrane protein [Legionella quinlivanii]|uniref:Cytochrome b561 transmembrane protein n=1 Tax=Legionella quinlivanii TaxID=45073 RepID=A0A0W0Y0Y8_9GAMM|nr:cytochrome b [Legionella quinlivanii]KTD50469.1 cytochrome b561 transmembrane protein [Legionella quinlivanii]SEF39543.1 cytochrome b561 [Legionella quinlivanii DSM 21216]STY12069.1 cytochrome b561 transmembrane protein [Legionella quinlivanii]